MPGKLAYEPSVQAILEGTLHPGFALIGGDSTLRFRGAWPLVARATGLGQIEGGEIVLSSAARSLDLLHHLTDIARAGVVALVVTGPLPSPGVDAVSDAPIPVAYAPQAGDPVKLQRAMETFIARRRRELFGLEQSLHRVLVEAAIDGASPAHLLKAAHGFGVGPCFLDRDGDLLIAPENTEIPGHVLVELRHQSPFTGEQFLQTDHPRTLAMPVRLGRQVRGLAGRVLQEGAPQDEDEAVVAHLASALAIVLGREPQEHVPPLEDALASTPPELGTDRPWVALAFDTNVAALDRLNRAVLAELTGRSIRAVAGSIDNELIVAARPGERFDWSNIVDAIGKRLGTKGVRAGLGRPHGGTGGVRRSVAEARDALAHARLAGITSFESVELQVVLTAIPRPRDFVTARLGPFLADTSVNRELRDTLRTYLDSGRNAKEAARRLKVHRNTLLYRMKKIGEVLEVEWQDSEAVFGLDLALRLLALEATSTNQDVDTG